MSTATLKKPRRQKRLAARKPIHGGLSSVTLISDTETLEVPNWVRDLASFRRWVLSDEVPEKNHICFLDGEVWIDMSKEQIHTHIRVKREYTIVLGTLDKIDRRGEFLPDGVALVNLQANLSCGPDGLYFLKETLANGRIQLVDGKKHGYVELQGSPDMVLEIVSDGSVSKDLVKLRELYWQAEIPEYWLVDVRGDEVIFEIYRHAAKGYIAARKQDGWIKSNVYGKSFRLIRQNDEQGHPEFTLEVK